MTEYQLPMKDGKVDMVQFSMDMGYPPHPRVKMLNAFAAHARAGERKRCENACWAEHKKAGDGTDGAYRLQRAILAIRNMGDE